LEELGGFYFDRGDPSLFREPVEKALAIRQDAVAKAHDNIALQRGSERAIGTWGCLLAYFDPSGENVSRAAESLDTLRKLYNADPHNLDLAEEFLTQLQNFGSFLADRQQNREASELFEELIAKGRRLIQDKKGSHSVAYSMGEAAFDLFYCYLKLGDLGAAKRVAAELVGPLAEEFHTEKWDTPDDRFIQAGFDLVTGELASRNGEHQKARKFCERGISRLEENLRVRDYPGEKAFYGVALTRFGDVLASGGDPKIGVEYIERGLKIIHPLLDANLTLTRGELSSDISKADDDLRRWKEELRKTDGGASLVVRNK
jgi:tetratricopeptide (TPR) repeat protein